MAVGTCRAVRRQSGIRSKAARVGRGFAPALLAALLSVPFAARGEDAREARSMESMLASIEWLGHASFRITVDTLTVYIDPWQLSDGPERADVILITHDHRDHCSPEDIAKIADSNTVVVAVKQAAAKLDMPVTVIAPNESTAVSGVAVKTVPSYNVNKFRSPGVPFHPKEAGYVGYIVTLGGQRIYHAGDADFIPEMQSLEVDIALLPVSGTYVMTPEESAQAAKALQPKAVIPMHIGRGIGSLEDAETFKKLCSVPVVVKEMTE